MSDNVTPIFEETEQPKKKLSLKTKWIIFISIVVVIIALLVWFLLSNSTALDGIKRFFRYLGIDEDSYGTINFDTYGNCSYALADDSFAIVSQSGLTIFSEGGSSLNSLSGNYKNPMLDSVEDKVLLYDVGGTTLSLFNSEGEKLFLLNTPGIIFDADVCEDGLCAVIYEGSDCYAVLEVYNEKGAKLYAHRSQSTFLNTCALSPDGSYVVVSTLGQEDISFLSTARILTTKSEGIAATMSFGTQVICDMAFLDDETLCAIGEDSVFFFTASGTLLNEYTKEQSQLAGYCFADESIIVLYDNYDLNLGFDLLRFDRNGQVIAALDLSSAPQHISTCGYYICLTDAENILIYDDEFNLKHSTQNNAYSAALARSDGTALCIGNGYAELYIP